MTDEQKPKFIRLLGDGCKYLKLNTGVNSIPKLILRKDQANSDNFFGKTAYYSPSDNTIVLYITDRHPKDIVRSYFHEFIHFIQFKKNMFDIKNQTGYGENYAQENQNLRKSEKHAYLVGNMLFRDFCDMKKLECHDKT